MIGGNDRNTGRKKLGIAIAILTIVIILICAWAPWVTEDYARNKVTSYLVEKGRSQENINLTDFQKVPFGMRGALLVSSPAPESSTPEKLYFYVTFYGGVAFN